MKEQTYQHHGCKCSANWARVWIMMNSHQFAGRMTDEQSAAHEAVGGARIRHMSCDQIRDLVAAYNDFMEDVA